MSSLTAPIQRHTGSLSEGNKKTKSIQMWKERKLSLSTDNMIVYVENTKTYPPPQKKKSGTVTSMATSRDTSSTYKSQMHSCILAMNNWNCNFKKNTIYNST